MEARKKYTLLQKLKNLQSCFNLQMKTLTQRKAKTVLQKLQKELDCDEYDHLEEKIRYYNLITFLHYFCRNVEAAKQSNINSLKICEESIVALGNQAWICYLEGERYEDLKEIEQILTKVEELSADPLKLAVAKSEMAYSYARFGLLYYTRAESIYEEVLKDVEGKDEVPIFLWQYGCGLTKKRLLYNSKNKFKGNDREYNDSIARAASLLFEVAEQNENKRYKARAWAELGNLALLRHPKGLFLPTMGTLLPDKMFKIAMEINNQICDIAVLEQCAVHYNRLGKLDVCNKILYETKKVKETSRANQLLAGNLRKQLIYKLKGKKPIPECKDTREILKLYDSAIASQNIVALGFKGHFLMEMGKDEEAIKVFENVYRSLQQTDKEQEDFDWEVKFRCQTHHAMCLLRSYRDKKTIPKAKELLWSAIELYVQIGKNGKKQNKSLTIPVTEMQKLLQNEPETPESIFEQIALCELVQNKDRADKLREKIGKEEMITVKQPEVSKRLIKALAFDEGLFLLNQMLVSNTLPDEMKEFAIKAHIDGAINDLEKGDGILGRTRALAAFDIRYPNQNTSITQERLHVFFLAHECQRELTRELLECFTTFTSLDITSCFDMMPGRLIFSSLEENMHQSSVLAILCNECDLAKDDYDSRLFQTSVEIAQLVHMTHGEGKVLIVITPSDQDMIPSRLSYVPNLPLGKLYKENKKKWLHQFFLRALLKGDSH